MRHLGLRLLKASRVPALALALLAFPAAAHAQFGFGGGGLGYGYPGFSGGGFGQFGGVGYGGVYGYPGFGYGYPGFGYGVGYPAYGYGGYGQFGGFGYGYNPLVANPFAYAAAYGYANPYFGAGLTPLAIQSALQERQLGRAATLARPASVSNNGYAAPGTYRAPVYPPNTSVR